MFGISTHCLSNEPLKTALDCLAPLTTYVEVMDDGLHYLLSAELLESYSFQYSFHAPARGVNLASQLEPIRKASVEVITGCFEVASEVGAAVVVHPGYFAWASEKDRAISQCQRSLSKLVREADDAGVTFSVENMPQWEHFFLRRPEDLDLINGCGLTLDVGHAHLNECLSEFLDVQAVHYHLHDNDGTEDSHLAAGMGTIDFKPVMEAIKNNKATAVIEVNSFEWVTRTINELGLTLR